MIHLELLKMQLAGAPDALEHVSVIVAQVRRLDEVVQGFLKFTRPEDLKLQPVYLAPLFEELMPIISAEASKSHVDVRLDVPADLPPVQGDPSLLEQAFLNLALNACQAMPHGGRLRISARGKPGQQIEVEFEDTRRRHLARPPVEDLRSLFHDEAARQRHRPLPRVSDGAAARRRYRGPVDSRAGHDVPGAAAPGDEVSGARHGRFCVIMDQATMSYPLRAAVVLLSLSSLAACNKVQARVPVATPALSVPAPESRLVIPAPAIEAPVETPPPARPAPGHATGAVTKPNPPSNRQSQPAAPAPQPVGPPPAAADGPPQVLQTTATVGELEKRAQRADRQRRARPGEGASRRT